jgi:cytosine/adenosine deaminase-related metal-dependent hydrolase
MAIVRALSYTRKVKAAKEMIRYIQHRIGKDGEKKYRQLFQLSGDMERIDAYEMLDASEKGSVFFHFMISPDQRTEDIARDLDLRELTRKTMLALQEQIQAGVPYAAAIHDDHTELRHVHLIACLTSRLGVEHFKTMRDTATEEAGLQRQERDAQRQQQQKGGQWLGLAAS